MSFAAACAIFLLSLFGAVSASTAADMTRIPDAAARIAPEAQTLEFGRALDGPNAAAALNPGIPAPVGVEAPAPVLAPAAAEPESAQPSAMMEKRSADQTGPADDSFPGREKRISSSMQRTAQALAGLSESSDQESAGDAEERAIIESFERLPPLWHDLITSFYTFKMRENFEGEGEGGAIYGARWKAGEENARTLVALGAEVTHGANGETRLTPPPDLITILVRYARHMRSERIPEDEEVSPALTFVYNWGVERRYLFVRPGIDPWPDPKLWDLYLIEGPLPDKVWFDAIADGRLPIGGLLVHELAHVTEFYAHPEIAKLMRLYAAAYRGGLVGNHSTAGGLRAFLLYEILSLPNLQKKPLIRSLIPQWYQEGGPRTLDADRKYLQGLTPREREKHVDGILRHSEEILARHGGVLRDFYNFDRYLNRVRFVQYVRSEFLNESDAKDWRPGRDLEQPQLTAAMESLHGLMFEIRTLWALRYSPAEFAEGDPYFGWPSVREAAKPILDMKAEEKNERLDQLLIDRTARLETALYEAIRLEITPERVHSESRFRPPAPGTATYEYFRSYLPPGGAMSKAFGL